MIQKKLINKLPKIKVEDAISLLERSGYTVIKNINHEEFLSDKDIVDFFYTKLKEVLPDKSVFYYNANLKGDLSSLDSFHQKAKTLSLTNKEVNKYLKETIGYLFNNIDKLELKSYPTSLSFLISSSGNWIFKKCLDILTIQQLNYTESKEYQMYLDSIYSSEDEAYKDLKAKKTKQLLGENIGE